jgi:arylsulfatase A-like enzyme
LKALVAHLGFWPLVCCTGLLASAGDQERRANVLLLVADDLGVDKVSAYEPCTDPPAPNTPRIDALADAGILFRRAYAYPLCSPARACLQSGRWGFRTGIGTNILMWESREFPLDEITIGEMLDRGGSGYAHAFFGKWHLGFHEHLGVPGDPQNPGYGHFVGSPKNFVRRKDPPRGYHLWDKTLDGETHLSETFATTDLVDETLSWIQAQADTPWVATVAFHAPHTPLERPPGFDLPHEQPRRGDDWWPYHNALIESMDTEIGRLLDTFERTAPASHGRTLVVFIGDNGTARNKFPGDEASSVIFPPFERSHGKGTLFEGGIHVPLIASGYPIDPAARGSVSDALVSIVDFFGTIADIAGVDLEDPEVIPRATQLDTISFLPVLQDPSHPGRREWVYAEIFDDNLTPGAEFRGSRALLDRDFKIVWTPSQPAPADFRFYDLRTDPHERVDLLDPLQNADFSPYEGDFLRLRDELFGLFGL